MIPAKFNIFFLFIALSVLPNLLMAQTGFKNPIIRGFNPDPSICRVGEDFYLVTSSFEYFPGLPIYHSKDLINWQQIGHCLTRPSQLPLHKVPSSNGLFAPSLRYHKGKFYVICTNVSGGGNFYCTADNPAGPWSEPIWVKIESIDPDIFWDDDGRTYFVTQGNEGVRITEIDIATGKVLGAEKLVWGGTGGRFPEAPHVYKKDGFYYLMLGEGGTEYAHSTTIGRSKYLLGPYEGNPLNPIITHCNRIGQGNIIQGVGHADLIQAADSSWWAVFLGFRVIQPYAYYHILGRETFLAPVDWPKNGWPQVNGNGIIHVDMNVPTLPLKPFALQKSLVDFSDPALGFEWQYLRNPNLENYSLSERVGYLRMNASPYTLNEAEAVSFIGRRQTEHHFAAETSLELVSANDKEEAGMTLIQNNSHHYDLLLRRKSGKYVIELRVTLGGHTYIAAEQIINQPAVTFRVEGNPYQYSFSYQDKPNAAFVPLKKLDTKYLSTEVAGGFTGVMVGLYTSSNGVKTTAKAYFDKFDYKVMSEN